MKKVKELWDFIKHHPLLDTLLIIQIINLILSFFCLPNWIPALSNLIVIIVAFIIALNSQKADEKNQGDISALSAATIDIEKRVSSTEDSLTWKEL